MSPYLLPLPEDFHEPLRALARQGRTAGIRARPRVFVADSVSERFTREALKESRREGRRANAAFFAGLLCGLVRGR